MKNIFLTLLACSIFTIAQSQITFKPGVKLGLNISKIENVNDDKRKGIYFGVTGEFNFLGISNYAIQPEISYSQQGTKNYQQDFFVITLANKIYFIDSEYGVYAILAPSVDIKLNGPKEVINASSRVELGSDYGMLGGFGYEFPFGLGIEARYKFSLKSDESDDARSSFGKNSSIQMGLTYKFDLKR